MSLIVKSDGDYLEVSAAVVPVLVAASVVLSLTGGGRETWQRPGKMFCYVTLSAKV